MARSNLGKGDQSGSSSRVRTSEDKVCRKDWCWSVRAVYVLVKLPDVSGPGLGEAGRYIMVSEPTLAVSRARMGISARACGRARGGADATGMWTGAWRVSARASGMRRWHWMHGRGTETVGTRRTDVALGCWQWTYGTWPREDVPGLGLTDEDVGLLRG